MSRPRRAQALLLLVLGAVFAGCLGPSGPPIQLTFQLDTDGAVPAATALAEARDVVRERLDQFGVDEAVVEVAPGNRLSVRFSSAEDSERVRRLILSQALLELRLVRFPAGDEKPGSSPEAVLSHYGGQLPPDLEVLEEEVRDEGGKVTGVWYHAVEKQPVITGRDLENVRPSRGQLGEPILGFSVKPEAKAALGNATGSNIGSALAIVLDGRVVSAPRINARIESAGIVEGGFTQEQTQDLAIMLRSGALPGRLTIVEEKIEAPGGR